MTEATLIHKGHRQRMRDKLLEHGSRVMQSYELLEMLLYYAIPTKDTNAVAKRLVLKLGSLDGVFSASEEELMSVKGVGPKAARLIVSAGELMRERAKADIEEQSLGFCDVGNMFVERLSPLDESKTFMMLFDNKMKPIACEEIYGYDFSSGAVRAEGFISFALKHHAAIAISAHNHPHGPLFPTVGDMATGRMITEALHMVGVEHIEHYVICGDKYTSVVDQLSLSLVQTPEVESFIMSREKFLNGSKS